MSTDDIIEEEVVTPPTRLPEISKEQVRDENNSDDKVKKMQESKTRSAMSKAGIIEEVVTPLMKHLEIAEKHVFRLPKAKEQVEDSNSDGKVRETFEEIKKIVKNKKDMLDDRKKWEDGVTEKFSVVEQHIDNILEDKECNTSDELRFILETLNKIMENVTPSQRPQGEEPKSSDSEKDEPSFLTSWDDCSIPFIDEIIDTIDPQLRQCLYCLSIFPKNSIIKRRLLIYWWIGLKLVRPEGDNTAEQIGGILFNDLLDKGILIPTIHGIRKHSSVVDRCTVDLIFHEKLISSAKKKRFIIERKEISGSSLEVCAIRKNRLDVETLLNIDENYLKSGFIKSENPKSGFVKTESDVSSKKSESGGSSKKTESDVSAKKSVCDLKKMAVMQVGQWRCVGRHHIEADTTDFLNELIPNLTYLSLQNISRISELPEAIAKSTSLMILDIRACHNLENLPPKSTALKSLTHLDVSMCYLLDHIPKWISTLNNLEVLKGFVIGSSGNKNRCRLSDISNLPLRKLTINIGRDSNISAEEFNNLKKLSKLRSLTLTWAIDEKVDQNGSVQNKQETINDVTLPQTQVLQTQPPEQEQKNPRNEQENEISMMPPEQKKEKEISVVVPQTPQLQAKKPMNEQEKNSNVATKTQPPELKEKKLLNIFHEDLEKLDLRCFPETEAPTWLNPTNLKKLKRLYIRGGKIGELGGSNAANAGDGLAVETLRLRFLQYLKPMKAENFLKIFPKIKFLEWAERDKSGHVNEKSFDAQEIKNYKANDAYLFSSSQNNTA